MKLKHPKQLEKHKNARRTSRSHPESPWRIPCQNQSQLPSLSRTLAVWSGPAVFFFFSGKGNKGGGHGVEVMMMKTWKRVKMVDSTCAYKKWHCANTYMFDILHLVGGFPSENINPIGLFLQVRVKTSNIWNHHLVVYTFKCSFLRVKNLLIPYPTIIYRYVTCL